MPGAIFFQSGVALRLPPQSKISHFETWVVLNSGSPLIRFKDEDDLNSISLFQQPMGDEHQGDAGQRHPQGADDKNGSGGQCQPAEERQHNPLSPAVNQVTAGNRAPNARRPEIMLVEQIHPSTLWRNPLLLASFSRIMFLTKIKVPLLDSCSPGSAAVPAASGCEQALLRNTPARRQSLHGFDPTSQRSQVGAASQSPAIFPQRAYWHQSGVVLNLCCEPVLQAEP